MCVLSNAMKFYVWCAILTVCLIIGIKEAKCKLLFDNYNLELVQVVFRHGERTPQRDEVLLIENANISLQEPWGYSQLTNTGKMQEYKLGEMLRERYGDFLGEYKPDHVYACSSEFDRTKASLQLVLASLYPPSEDLTWNRDLSWNPIPTHFLPYALDTLFNLDSCSEFKRNWRKLMYSREIKNQLKEFDDVFKLLSKVYPNIKIDVMQLFFMNNLLNIQRSANVRMPDWYTPELHERIANGAKFYLDTLSYDLNLKRMNGGSLTRRMTENMDIHGWNKNPRKIYLYSGHEFTVYAVAKVHNVTLPKSPAYGSALILEKLRNQDDELFVRLLYWTGPTQELLSVKLSSCDEYCPIKNYLNIVRSSFPSDDDLLCLYKNLKPTDLKLLLKSDLPVISL